MLLKYNQNNISVEIAESEFQTEKQNVIDFFLLHGFLSKTKKAIVKYLKLKGVDFDQIILNEL